MWFYCELQNKSQLLDWESTHKCEVVDKSCGCTIQSLSVHTIWAFIKQDMCAPRAHEYIVHPQCACMHTTCIFKGNAYCKLTPQVELEGSSKLSVSWMQVLDNQQGIFLLIIKTVIQDIWLVQNKSTLERFKYSQGNSLVVKQEVYLFHMLGTEEIHQLTKSMSCALTL